MRSVTNSAIVQFSKVPALVQLVPALKNAERLKVQHVRTGSCGSCRKSGSASRVSHQSVFNIIRRQLGNMSPQMADRFCRLANENSLLVEYQELNGSTRMRLLERLK